MDDQEIQDGAQPSVCLAKVRQRHGAERRKSTAPGTLEKMKERIEVRRAAEEKKEEKRSETGLGESDFDAIFQIFNREKKGEPSARSGCIRLPRESLLLSLLL